MSTLEFLAQCNNDDDSSNKSKNTSIFPARAMARYRKGKSSQKNFRLYVKFDYDIKAASEAEAREIMFRLFLDDIHDMAASVETVEDLQFYRNKIAYRTCKGGL